ncbi:MAG TPA: glycosyltransferase family 39 protein, partial [Tepidisphaeraceae bacterium]|nr:glycosyltransferase family 39 protein [Tepidisphaeraceae bacterium]
AYWLSAVSIDVFGPSDLAARVPAVLASWAMMGLTFLLALRLFNQRAAIFAALALFGSNLFFKQAVLAETDILVAAFMTGAIWTSLKIADMQNQNRSASERGFLALLAALIACTILVKGPQAFLLLLALIAFDLVRHRLGERPFRNGITIRLFTTGAFLITALLALPWFVYVLSHAGGEQLASDLQNSAGGGRGHAKGFFAYFGMLPMAVMPWSIVWGFALWITFVVLRRNRMFPSDSSKEISPDGSNDISPDDSNERRSLWLLLAWGCAVFVPLMFWGNKQIHYLLPLMPAAMISVGWMLDRSLRDRTDPSSKIVNGYVKVLLVVCALIVPALPIVGNQLRSHTAPIDYMISFVLAVAVITSIALLRKGADGTLTRIATIMSAIVFFTLSAFWVPTLDPVNSHTITMGLREKFPNATFVFRNEPSLAMVAAFDRVIPVMSEEQLAQLSTDPTASERVICLDTDPFDKSPLTNFEELERIIDDDDTVVVYTADGSMWDEVP